MDTGCALDSSNKKTDGKKSTNTNSSTNSPQEFHKEQITIYKISIFANINTSLNPEKKLRVPSDLEEVRETYTKS